MHCVRCSGSILDWINLSPYPDPLLGSLNNHLAEMAFHDEVEIEDFEYDDETSVYTYPCPCGDRFTITKEELARGEDVARCPSCSLIVKVIYNLEDFLAAHAIQSSNGGSGPAKIAVH